MCNFSCFVRYWTLEVTDLPYMRAPVANALKCVTDGVFKSGRRIMPMVFDARESGPLFR